MTPGTLSFKHAQTCQRLIDTFRADFDPLLRGTLFARPDAKQMMTRLPNVNLFEYMQAFEACVASKAISADYYYDNRQKLHVVCKILQHDYITAQKLAQARQGPYPGG